MPALRSMSPYNPVPSNTIIALLLVCSTWAVPPLHAQLPPPRPAPIDYTLIPPSDIDYQVEMPARLEALATDRILTTLALRPGMTIVDLGTGFGHFALAMAELMKGQVTIHATDVNATSLNLLEQRAKRRGLEGIHPVLVRTDGLDPFYTTHRFDLVFLGEVYENLVDPIDFFRKLKPHFAPGARLFILNGRLQPSLTALNLPEPKAILDTLGTTPSSNPILLRSQPALKALLTDPRVVRGDYPLYEQTRPLLLVLLNDLLSDPSFFQVFNRWADLQHHSASSIIQAMAPWNRYLARHLYFLLSNGKVLEKSREQLTPFELENLKWLNFLILEHFFRPHLRRLQFAWTHILNPTPVQVQDELQHAGYRLVQHHQFLPFHDLLEFVPNSGELAPRP